MKALRPIRLLRCALALFLSAASVYAADSETPSVFRPTVRELPSPPMPSPGLPNAARFGVTATGNVALIIPSANGPEEIVASWPRVNGDRPTEPPAAVTFPDGTLLLAYRRPTPGGSSLIVLQQAGGQWQRPKTIAADTGPGAPRAAASQPVLARSGARAVIAWYAESDGEPQVLASTSPDAGGMFVQAERIDLGRPAGGVALALLHDGTQFVSWIERPGDDASQPGGLYLRRTTAYGATLPPARLLRPDQIRPGSQPRLTVVTDEPDAPVQLRVTYAPAGSVEMTKALLVTLPDPAVLAEADRSCGCTPTAAETAGVTIRARVISATPDQPTVRLRHGAVPGLLRAGETEFATSRQVAADVRAGLDVLAHLDEVNGTWTLLGYRVLATGPSGP